MRRAHQLCSAHRESPDEAANRDADEKTLAAACQDGSVRLWDLSEYLPGQQVAEKP